MNKRIFSLGVILAESIMLSSCAVVPGMHMSSMKLTPTPNKDGEVITPKITPISASLIIEQQKEREKSLAKKRESYHKSSHFYTDGSMYEYEVGVHDVISISVYDIPGLDITTDGGTDNFTNYKIKVEKDGNIFYPYLGYIQAEGKTVKDIKVELVRALSTQIKDPQVSVEILGFNSHHVNVVGKVTNLGAIPLTDKPLSVLDAVTASSPILCSSEESICSDLRHVTVRQNGEEEVVDLKSLQAVDGSSNNWILNDGAVVTVPDTSLSQIYVLGGVREAGPFRMYNDTMSLREAIGRAGGSTTVSDPGYTYVIRDFGSQPEVFLLNLRSPDALNLAGQFRLAPHDVVFVSTSKLQDFNTVLSEITPTLTAYALVKSID